MRQIHDHQYAHFTPNERLSLTVAALARGDKTESDRLWQTCPRYDYRCYDLEYTLRIHAVMMLGSLFFEQCVRHYNRIKKADLFITHAEWDLALEESDHQVGLADQTRQCIAVAKTSRAVQVSRLKGLFDGFKLFCHSAGLDSENLLKMTPIQDACQDLDQLLASDREVDLEYTNQMKDFFREYWHF